MSGLNWWPLAEADPVPGDPAAIRVLAAQWQQSAMDVGEQVQTLRRIGRSADWIGPAAQAFQERTGRLPADLDLVGERFQRVAQALREFAPALESAQRRARVALARAQEAHVAQPATALTAQASFVGPTLASGPPAGPLAQVAGPLTIGGGDRELAHARDMLAAACEERDRAGARCARALAAAGHDRLRNPSGWHRFLGAVSAWAGVCSTWLGVAALVLCFVPGVGPLLGAASLALALVQLGADVTLAAGSDAGWGSAGLDLLGVVPLGRAARLGATLSRGRAIEQAAGLAAVRRRGPALAGRALQRLAATPLHFERSRGLHGVAQLVRARPGREVAAAANHLAVAVRSAAATRSLSDLLRSPGGLLDEIARASSEGPGGLLWLSGGHTIDAVQATAGVPFTPQTSGAS
jgi:uncharacterized protein YukE